MKTNPVLALAFRQHAPRALAQQHAGGGEDEMSPMKTKTSLALAFRQDIFLLASGPWVEALSTAP